MRTRPGRPGSAAGVPGWCVAVLTLLSLAMALSVWPDERARRRLLGARRSPGLLVPYRGRRAVRMLPVPVTAALGGVAAGIGGACSAAALTVLAVRMWRSRQEHRRSRERVAQLVGGLRLLIDELRAGAHPAMAAEGAATCGVPRDDAPAENGRSDVANVFLNMAATARLGGNVSGLLRDEARWPELRWPLARIGKAWELADRHGAALADLLDSVRRDLDHRVRFAGEVEARMAGPRATAIVLSGLPVLGLLLGEAVGSAPLTFLTGGSFGQLLLVIGTGLICGGIVWTRRLTGTAVPL